MCRMFLRLNGSKMQNTPPAPRWPYPRVLLDALLVSGALVGVMVLASRFLGSDSLTKENGWLENTQSLLLSAAFLCGAFASIHANTRMWRCIAVVLASIAAVGWARELQTLSQEMPSDWWAIPRWTKRLIYGVAVTSALSGTMMMFIRERTTMLRHLGPRFIWPGIVFIVCFVAAELFERGHFVFMEEVVEIFAYSLLLLVNVWILRTHHDDQTLLASS